MFRQPFLDLSLTTWCFTEFRVTSFGSHLSLAETILKPKILIMNNLLTILAVILLVFWASAYFAFHVAGAMIHILLVVAVVALLLRLIRGNKA
jgi:hypothetical protein